MHECEKPRLVAGVLSRKSLILLEWAREELNLLGQFCYLCTRLLTKLTIPRLFFHRKRR